VRFDVDYTLCFVTDRGLTIAASVEECVVQAIAGGCTMVQLREKTATDREFYEAAVRLRAVTIEKKIPLIINDRADIALAVDADGLHIGRDDLPVDAARRIIGRDKILGVSASGLEEAVTAEKNGADYVGVGAMFATGTKTDAKLVSLEELKRIRDAVRIPIVVIGGVNKQTAPLFKGAGADGIAVVSAIACEKDAKGAAAELVRLFTGN